MNHSFSTNPVFFISLLFVNFLVPDIFSQQQDSDSKFVNWLTWNQALKAREKFIADNKQSIDEGKLLPKKIFIDISTSWCGWCKKMDQTTFRDPAIVDYLNNGYFPVKMDGEMKDTIVFNNHTFINQNPSVARGTHTLPGSLLDWKLSYPSYVIMDENLNRAAVYAGYKPSEDLLGILLFFKTNQNLPYINYVESQFQLKQKTN